MAYSKTNWTDRVVEFPNRYKDQALIQYTFARDEGVVTEAGTFVNAGNMNKLEQGVADAHSLAVAMALLFGG